MYLTDLDNITNKKTRIFKLDRDTRIKNFIWTSQLGSQLNVILPDEYKPYAIQPDGSKIQNIFFESPFYSSLQISEYVHDSRHALVNDRFYIFGGSSDGNKVII